MNELKSQLNLDNIISLDQNFLHSQAFVCG